MTVAISMLAPAARADEVHDRAEALFREGIALVDLGRFDEACPKLEESQRLDPAPGTALDLAYCLERSGKLVEAEARYLEAARIADARGRSDRSDEARARLTRLLPRIPRVRMVLPTSDIDGMSLRLDGVSVTPGVTVDDGEAILEMKVDPGPHLLEIDARSGGTFARRFDVAEGAQALLLVPAAVFERPAPPVLQPPSRSPERPADAQAKAGARADARRTWAIVAGVSGVAFAATGGISAILAATHHAESERLCAPVCTGEARSAERTADAFAWGANIGLLAGGLLLGTAAVLWLASPRGSSRSTSAVVGPLRF